MLSAFIEEKVEFMLIGSYALAFHGFPRATGDIDLWVRCSNDNAERVWRALARFGAPLSNLNVNDLTKPGTVFQIGVAPNRIDILNKISAVEFDEAMLDSQTVEIDGLSISVISRSHLIRNKKAAGRPKDKADVAWLESGENGFSN
jgi:predicted nucleotidyltransferase